MCFEGSFDGRDESRMSNTVNYPCPCASKTILIPNLLIIIYRQKQLNQLMEKLDKTVSEIQYIF